MSQETDFFFLLLRKQLFQRIVWVRGGEFQSLNMFYRNSDMVAPSRNPVAPSQNPVVPSRNHVAPSRNPVAPSRNPVAPSPKTVVPSRNPVAPSRNVQLYNRIVLRRHRIWSLYFRILYLDYLCVRWGIEIGVVFSMVGGRGGWIARTQELTGLPRPWWCYVMLRATGGQPQVK